MAVKKLPRMENLPKQDLYAVLTEFYSLRAMVDKDMDIHQINYATIRLATVIEQFFRCVVEIKLRNNTMDVPKKVELSTHIIDEIASRVSRSPKRTIRNRIISLTYLFQNTNAITTVFGPKTIEDVDKKILDKLFKHRHNLVHSVDPQFQRFTEIRECYDVTEKIIECVLDSQNNAELSFDIVKGQSLHNLKDVDGSKKCYNAALNKFKNHNNSKWDKPNLHFGIGLALQHLGDHDLAIKSFDKAIKLNSDITKVHMYKGRSLFLLEHYYEAVNAFMAEIKIEPNNAQALLLAGMALNAVGKWEKALVFIDRAIINEPGSTFPYIEKEKILRSYGLHIWADGCHK